MNGATPPPATDWSDEGQAAIQHMIRAGACTEWLARVLGWAEQVATAQGADAVGAGHVETGVRLAGKNLSEIDY